MLPVKSDEFMLFQHIQTHFENSGIQVLLKGRNILLVFCKTGPGVFPDYTISHLYTRRGYVYQISSTTGF